MTGFLQKAMGLHANCFVRGLQRFDKILFMKKV